MADTLTAAERSERMSRVRGRDTKPELAVRRMLHAARFRYRLHRRDLPGAPDIVFPSRRAVVFVHGCFWHRHTDPNCKLARLPKSRREFWLPKLEANAGRDARDVDALAALGWRVKIVWECQLSDLQSLRDDLLLFLSGEGDNESN